ncbi:MAG: thiamine phosphate synthase, partial [Planctomycetaceae bacterium]
MNLLLTEGSRRVLALADRLAQSAGLPQCGPLHLLQALWLDESRAHEILHAQGLDARVLHQQFQLPLTNPQPATPDPQAPVHQTPDHQAPAPPLPHTDDLQRILLEARQVVTSLGRHVEIATEHLLQALLTVASPVQAQLTRLGISASPPGTTPPSAELPHTPLPTDITLSTAPGPASDQAALYRILDAAANRASEGLRVVEDYLRFALNDRFLTEQLKHCRHQLAQALRLLPTPALLACRETLTDVGTTLHTRHELHRHSLLQVVRADFKRVQEACRSLEEFGKRISPEFSAAAGQVRYHAYTLERALFTAAHSADRLAGCELYLLLTESLCPQGSGPVLRAALRGGVRVVQIREKTMPDRLLLEHARRVRQKTAEAGALLIMNDRPDLAVLCDADGV